MRKELLMCSPTEIAWHHTSVDVFAGPPLLTLPCMLWHPELLLCRCRWRHFAPARLLYGCQHPPLTLLLTCKVRTHLHEGDDTDSELSFAEGLNADEPGNRPMLGKELQEQVCLWTR